MRALRTLPFLVATTLVASGCSSFSAFGHWAGAPALQFLGLDRREKCDDQPHLVPPLATNRRLTIGAWNMHYLGPSEKTPKEYRDPHDLAEVFRISGASVVALEEIGVTMGPRGPYSPMLDAVFADLRSRLQGDWTYLLYGNAEKDKNQFVGLAWNREKLRQVGDPLPLNLRCDDPPGIVPYVPWPISTDTPLRQPFAVKLATEEGSDFVFVPVHLPARIETYLFEDATAHREIEAKALAEELPRIERHFHDRDVVVLGDFNIEFSTEDVTEVLRAQGWRDLNCANVTTYELGTALDHVFVPNDQPEFGLSNFRRVFPPEVKSWSDLKAHYSDHVMVVADVLVGPDDD